MTEWAKPVIEIPVDNLQIDENVLFGKNVRIVGGPGSFLKIGAFTKIHNNSLILARGHLSIGEACWFGERTVIDGTGITSIGDFVGVGIGSSLYSHMEHGDILEGSNHRSKGRLTIGSDAWLVGQCLVSPVIIGEKSMAMLGSVIVKNMLPEHTYGGNPAKDLSEKFVLPWSKISLEHKENYLKEKILSSGFEDRTHVCREWPDKLNDSHVYYNISTREYVNGHDTNHWFPRLHWFLLSDTIRFRLRRFN